MRALTSGLILGVVGVVAAGCGGAPSAASMKRFALMNAPEPEEQRPAPPSSTAEPAPPAVAAASPAPAMSNAPAGVAGGSSRRDCSATARKRCPCRQSLELAQSAYAKIPAAEAALQANPNDTAASEQLGKYLCCVKNEWDLGLPHLARAADLKFRVLAAIDLTPNRSPQDTLSLGDQYWELASTTKPPSKRGLHLRAVHCYATAAAALTGSLEKIKAQKRIEEAASLYGRDEIERIVAPLKQSRAGESDL